MNPERINELLHQQTFPSDWIVAAMDSKGVIAARSRSFEEFVGQSSVLANAKEVNEQSEGVVNAVTKEGIPTLSAYSTAPHSGWRVALGIPREGLESELMHSAALLGAGLLLLFAFGLALSLFLGRRIASSVTGLTLPARDLIDGKPPRAPKVYFREANEVALAMADAAQKLVVTTSEAQAAADKLRDSEQALIQLNSELEIRVLERTNALDDLYNNAPCGYHTLDAQGRIIEINQTELDLLGYTREEVLGHSAALFFDEKNQAMFARNFPYVLRDGAVTNIEYEILRKDGSYLSVLISANGLLDAEGKFVSARATMTDNRVNKARQKQIDHLNRFLTDVLESLPVGILVLDKQRNVVLKNMRLGRMLDYPPELIDRKPLAFSEVVRFEYNRGDHPHQTYETALAFRLDLMASREAFQFERRRDSGVHLAITGQRIADDWILLTYADITASKLLLQALEVSKQDADAANLAKSRFLATMSHEIRTPLNAVMGMAQVLMQPNIPEPSRINFAHTILNSGRALLSLLNDILDLAKIEADKVVLESIAVAPAQLLDETKTLFAQSAHAKGLTVHANWSGAERPYLGDPERLRQMIVNLVSNAIKFTQQGSVHIEGREVACNAQNATLEFSVTDSGIGIPKQKQGLLFQTFSQADSSTTRNYGGTGLGLSIVRMLAQKMGGEAGVESEAGVGSRFWFRVEVGLSAAGALALTAQAPDSLAAARAPTSLLRGRVLVIEDNAINQTVMQTMLGQMGLDVVVADNGQQALDALVSGERAQLILTDLQMPVMDGYTAAGRIRQWEAQTQRRRRPIIALSADAYPEVRVRCLDAGMDEVLSKPVLRHDLWAALAHWLPVVLAADKAAEPALQKAVDSGAVISLLKEILPLFAQGKADGIGRFKVLQELVAGSALASEVADAGLALKAYQFDLARQRLLRMASTNEWEVAL